MSSILSGFECIKKVIEWWDGTSQYNVLNGVNFYNRYSDRIFYRVSYYNTNVCEHQEIILNVNLENGVVTINKEEKIQSKLDRIENRIVTYLNNKSFIDVITDDMIHDIKIILKEENNGK